MIFDKNSLTDLISGINSYSEKSTSYSPMYSNIGLEIHSDEKGIGAFWLHYNRFSRILWNKFIDFDYSFNENLSTPWKLVFFNDDKIASLAFFAPDAFMIEIDDDFVFASDENEALLKHWTLELGNGIKAIRGYSKNGDDRDPDESVPFILGYKKEKGKIIFAFEALEISTDSIVEKINNAPESVDECAEICLEMIKNSVGSLSFKCDDKVAEIAAEAVNGLISNLTKAPGFLSKHISSYPSRGYSSHFLWDSCFQNLAYEEMDINLAKDFMLQFVETQRPDGKYGQFLCSTWMRPHYSQPSLIGWASMRIVEKTKDLSFAKVMLDSIEKNNEWWINNRMTEFGLISCPHGLETGQDDSPRFDDGDTLACDMNSYLLSQINITAKIAEMIGDEVRCQKLKKEASVLSENMIKYLYCEEENIFYDALLKNNTKIRIVSPVSLLPLWADIDFPEDKAKDMIEKYLLNPEYLFGNVPFPSVAYNEEKYVSDGWWRGPTWMPEAWLMLETLEKYGYHQKMLEAASRLLDVLINDKKMHELFDSESGKGLGYAEQGWTCGIFIKLCCLLDKEV